MPTCSGCSREIDVHAAFCPRCGTPNPEAPEGAGRAAGPEAPASDELRSRLEAALGADFAVGSPLGHGGFATVYSVEDRRLSRRIAVKVLHPDLASSSSAVRRFIREAEAAASISHPHVLPIFFVGERPGLVYFGMPLVEGETLDARLAREGALPEAEAARIGAEMAEALAEAHARGLVHRDVKPANVLLQGPRQRVLVADFGIVKAASGPGGTLTGSGMAIGSPHYMSPEQASGSGELDHRGDIYSLGIVLWQMLAGAVPFDAPDSRDVLLQQMARPLPSLRERRPGVRPALARVVERCAAKDPAARWQSAAEVAEALRAAVSAEFPAASGEGPARVRALLASGLRGRRGRVAAAAAVVVAGAAVALALWGPRGAGRPAAPREAVERTASPVVAVLPFEVGSRGDTARGRETARLLTNAISGRFGVLTVDVNRLLGEWAVERRTTAAPLDTNAAFAYQRGANQVIIGSSIEAGGQLRLTADVYDTRTLTRLGSVEQTGHADSLFSLVDRLAGEVAQTLCDQPGFNPRNLCWEQAAHPAAPVSAPLGTAGGDSVPEAPAFHVRVGRDGSLSDLRIDRAASPEATQAALEALQTARFVPARLRGRAVDAWTRVEVPLSRAAPAGAAAEVPECADPAVSLANENQACYDARPVPRLAPVVPVPVSCGGSVEAAVVLARVSESGEVEGETALSRRSGCADFDVLARAFVLDLSFRPARKGGRAVPAHVALLVRPAPGGGKVS